MNSAASAVIPSIAAITSGWLPERLIAIETRIRSLTQLGVLEREPQRDWPPSE